MKRTRRKKRKPKLQPVPVGNAIAFFFWTIRSILAGEERQP